MALSDVEICNWAYEGSLNFIKTAIESNHSLLLKTDSSLRTGLHWACSSGKLDVVNFFIAEGSKVLHTDTYSLINHAPQVCNKDHVLYRIMGTAEQREG